MNWICSHCGEKFSRFRTRCPSDGQRVIEDLAGQLIGGRYRIRELIGIGGMDSTVWKAWQTGTERVVAVKVLPAAEEAAAKRFARGARIAANLNHPNCTVVHDYGRSDDGKLFLVMEFLSGQVLQDILGPEGMSVPDTLHVVDQVLQALEHAHAQRAVHRDLKPDNLFLCRKNDDPLHVKILDFGIAKYVEEDPEHTTSAEESTDKDDFDDLVTEQRQVCGTPQYMAPEQVVGARIDGRTDLYSLGCVMYRMLTGRLPFDGKTRYELYQKHLQEPPRPFSEVRPDLNFPERLELIIMKVLNKRPDHRFQSASEMRKALETVELPEDRLRRANRPRVSLKHTSPQDRGGPTPTVVPQSNWTLSVSALRSGEADGAKAFAPDTRPTHRADKSAPPPVPDGHAGHGDDEEVGVTIVPEGLFATTKRRPSGEWEGEANPLVEVDPNLLGKRAPTASSLRAAPQAPRAPTPQPGSAPRPAVSLSGASNVVLSPSLAAQDGAPRAVRQPTGLLNEAVVRHPASRSQLSMGPEVPRSSETEPNKLATEGDSKRRRLRVAAVLAAAFMVGVGGVALVLKLTQSQPTPSGSSTVSGTGTAARVEPGRVGVEQPVVAPAEKAEKADRVETADKAGREHAEKAEVVVAPGLVNVVHDAGRGIGETLGAVALAPRAELVQVHSTPPGATVRLVSGQAAAQVTPCVWTLPPGAHRLEVVLAGHEPELVEVQVAAEPPARGRAAPLEVTLRRVPTPPRTPLQRVSPGGDRTQLSRPQTPPVGETPTATRVEVVPEKPVEKGPETPPVKPNTKPQVRLLEDGPGDSGQKPGKAPTVRLLEDDAPPEPKKPQVKVLE